MQNYLLTSPLKSSWKLTDINYVLNYDALFHHEVNGKSKDFIFLKPYGVEIKTKRQNEIFVDELARDVQKDLSAELNAFHSVNFDSKYWKVITGNWLIRAINIILYRYKCIDRAISSNLNLFTTASDIGDYSFYTKDSMGIVNACMNSEWNYNLVSCILRKSFINKINIENYKTKNNVLSDIDDIEKGKRINPLKKALSDAFSIVQNFTYPLYKNNDYFIKDSYLNKTTELKLHLQLNQFPFLPKNKIEVPDKYNSKIRGQINLKKEKSSEIEKIIRFFIPHLLPTTYLENYSFINQKIENLKWPRNPKAIITANSYDFDELFKFWAAKKIIKGSKYYIFQHGTLHGNHVHTEYTNEYQVSDKFFNWGNKFKNKKNIEAINFKLFDRDKKKSKKFKILIICKARGNEHEAYDRSYEHKKIFEGIKKLIKYLPSEIIETIHFRIKDLFTKNDERDFLNSKKINILNSQSDIIELMKKSELVVHMYNSTGILECLSLNIPTMFFSSDSLNCRNRYDSNFISFCKENEIFYDSSELLANKITEKFDNIQAWWNHEELQIKRKLVCEQYSILPDKHSLRELTKNIKYEN